MRNGATGAIKGAGIAQTAAGQSGGRSIELLHSACISPSTQRHSHEASASAVIASVKMNARKIRI
jgi:hypothetical protein